MIKLEEARHDAKRMQDLKPSRTALRVAIRRAAHQILDRPKVFDDPVALSILGPDVAGELAAQLSGKAEIDSRALRAFLAVRSRYAEDELAQAVERGIRQYVVLGAGLDTFAFRNRHVGTGLRVFEVDHPSTQQWKREMVRASEIAIPADTVFVAVNFEQQSLKDELEGADFRAEEGAFVSWLGVVPYLTEEAFTSTMAYLASMAPESGVVFDYAVSRSQLTLSQRAALDALATRVAAAGEPFRLFFEPAELRKRLRVMGFRDIEDLGPHEINERYFIDRQDEFRVRGGLAHLVRAWL